jgi:hypothetical protein
MSDNQSATSRTPGEFALLLGSDLPITVRPNEHSVSDNIYILATILAAGQTQSNAHLKQLAEAADLYLKSLGIKPCEPNETFTPPLIHFGFDKDSVTNVVSGVTQAFEPQLKDFGTRLDGLNERVGVTEKTGTVNETNITGLTKQTGDLGDRVSAIEKANTVNETNITGLTKQTGDLGDRVGVAEKTGTVNETNITGLTKQTGDLGDRVSATEKANTVNETNITNMAKQASDLGDRVSATEKSNTANETNITHLTTRANAQDDRVMRLQVRQGGDEAAGDVVTGVTQEQIGALTEMVNRLHERFDVFVRERNRPRGSGG